MTEVEIETMKLDDPNFSSTFSITLKDSTDKHNFVPKKILVYGEEFNCEIVQWYVPEEEEQSDHVYGYKIKYGSETIDKIIVDKIKKDLMNRILFS